MENYESVDEKYLESESSSKSKGNFQYGNLEASYEIDTLRLLTMAFGMYGGGSKNNSDGSTIMLDPTIRVLPIGIIRIIMEKALGTPLMVM